MPKIIEFGDPIWYTDENKRHIAMYDGLTREECYKIREHHRRLQSMVDTYKEKYPRGLNFEYVDNYLYMFEVRKNRKVKLMEAIYDDGK